MAWSDAGMVDPYDAACERADDAEEAIRKAVAGLDAEHQPMWSAPGPGYTLDPQEGKEPAGCCCCFPGDGSWPCVSRMVADDLRRACAD